MNTPTRSGSSRDASGIDRAGIIEFARFGSKAVAADVDQEELDGGVAQIEDVTGKFAVEAYGSFGILFDDAGGSQRPDGPRVPEDFRKTVTSTSSRSSTEYERPCRSRSRRAIGTDPVDGLGHRARCFAGTGAPWRRRG